jgi:ABC-type polysaccharide/polyol phosphate transport system ATPase subunit
MSSLVLTNVSFFRIMESTRAKQKQFVVDNVSLEIQGGERIGLIGPNGAGKTTLLRLLAGIFNPDLGSIIRDGDVSTFLDGGFGLDPQLSGRSNAESRAIMAGLNRNERVQQVAWIQKFSELEKYFDEPIKSYSSGMLMRLVFAIGTAQTHDILLVDEGFGTADAHFQHKAMQRLRDMYSRAPITVLASHNLEILKENCTRGIVMSKSMIVFDGDIQEACDFYLNSIK